MKVAGLHSEKLLRVKLALHWVILKFFWVTLGLGGQDIRVKWYLQPYLDHGEQIYVSNFSVTPPTVELCAHRQTDGRTL